MNNRPSPLRRLSAHANWDVPKHTGIYDLTFDEHNSLLSSFWPTWRDPLVLGMSLVHLVAYALYIHAVLSLTMEFCRGWMSAIGTFLPFALGVQACWALKAVYLLDKGDQATASIPVIWRVIRCTLLTLPFSLIPSWVIGCLAWPLLRIGISGGSNFYDQSLMIGQYVQNSAWFIGARNGSIRDNLQTYTDMTILNRSRYWDCASEQTKCNLTVLGLALVIGYVLEVFIGLRLTIDLPYLGSVDGSKAIIFAGAMVWAACLLVINTTGLGAISILAYCRQEGTVAPEADLPADHRRRWLLYIPHAIIGLVIYILLACALLPKTDHIGCNPPVPIIRY